MVGFTQSVQAALISAEQTAPTTVGEARVRIAAALERPELQAQLRDLGISEAAAQARVAALTDQEGAGLANRIDSLPAGADGGIIGALIFVFIVLLITDILGFTKIFPFTRSIRR